MIMFTECDYSICVKYSIYKHYQQQAVKASPSHQITVKSPRMLLTLHCTELNCPQIVPGEVKDPVRGSVKTLKIVGSQGQRS